MTVYNIHAEGVRLLCMLHSMVKTILAEAHDVKHHFGCNRMLYDLAGVTFSRKTR
ncbi:hypothetical protein C8A05DRAFT_19688, partial [Staphylotrichum tortipilum]